MTDREIQSLRDLMRRLRWEVSDTHHPEDHPQGETHPLFAAGVEHACDEIDHLLVKAEADNVLRETAA